MKWLPRFRQFTLFFSLLLCITSVKALNFRVVQTIPSVMTNVQLAAYDLEGTGRGPTLFTIVLDNQGDNTQYTDLEIYYTLTVDCDAVSSSPQVAYKAKTDKFTIAPNSYTEVLSNDFLQEENPRTPIHLKHTLEEMEDNSALQQKVLDAGTVPTGLLTIEIELVGAGVPSDPLEIMEVEILNPSQLDLISPGVEAEGDYTTYIPGYMDPSLTFNWTSDLTANMYDGCAQCFTNDVFEIHIYKRRTGQSESDALASQPIVKERLRVPFYQLSAPGTLERGTTYYWRVYGILQGVVQAKIESKPFVFRYADFSDPEVDEIKRLLKSILTLSNNEHLLSVVDDYDKEIRLNQMGAPFSIEQLRKLEQDLITGRLEVISVTVE